MATAKDWLTVPIKRLTTLIGTKSRPFAIGLVTFGLSWLSAQRAIDGKPLWPSVAWSELLPPVVIAAISGLVAFLIAHSMQDPRDRRGVIRRRIGGGFRYVVTGVTVAVLSWSVEGLLLGPHGGEWTGLGVGLLLALLTWFLCWEHWRRRSV